MHKVTYASHHIELSSNLNELIDQWALLENDLPFYLKSKYVSTLEGCLNRPFQQFYGVVLKTNKPIGVVLIQRIRFEWIDSLNAPGAETGFWKRFLHASGRYLLSCFGKKLSIEISSLGNQTISGTHGFYFIPTVPTSLQIEFLEFIINQIQIYVPAQSPLKLGIIKDFTSHSDFKPTKHHAPIILKLDPEMVLHISEQVPNIEGYISGFQKKYRQRYKSIKSKGQDIEWRLLTESEICAYSDVFDTLYSAVFERSEFQMLKLPKGYFKNLALAFPDTFNILAGFYNNQLVVFGSCIKSNKYEVSAHYIGIDFKYEHLELYQNLLYQFIAFAITNKVKTLHFGRTAAEIKSTVGAVPQDLCIWIYPRGRISRWVIQNIIAQFKPKAVIYRSPFKKAEQELKTIVNA